MTTTSEPTDTKLIGVTAFREDGDVYIRITTHSSGEYHDLDVNLPRDEARTLAERLLALTSKRRLRRLPPRPPNQFAHQDLVCIDDGGALVWICEQCHQPIGCGEGYITIAYPRIEPPSSDTWEVLHRECDLHPRRYDYHFTVEECSSVEQLIDWDRHLRHKQWINQTNWWMVRGSVELAIDAVGAGDLVARIRRG